MKAVITRRFGQSDHPYFPATDLIATMKANVVPSELLRLNLRFNAFTVPSQRRWFDGKPRIHAGLRRVLTRCGVCRSWETPKRCAGISITRRLGLTEAECLIAVGRANALWMACARPAWGALPPSPQSLRNAMSGINFAT